MHNTVPASLFYKTGLDGRNVITWEGNLLGMEDPVIGNRSIFTTFDFNKVLDADQINTSRS